MTKPQCAQCRNEFEWDHAYSQQETPGSFNVRVGEWRPRAFCPHCGALVVDWDIDRDQDRDRWIWYGDNGEVNKGRSFPPGPLQFSGRTIPRNARPPVSQDRIDVKRMRQLFIENLRSLGVSEERIIELAGEEPS